MILLTVGISCGTQVNVLLVPDNLLMAFFKQGILMTLTSDWAPFKSRRNVSNDWWVVLSNLSKTKLLFLLRLSVNELT